MNKSFLALLAVLLFVQCRQKKNPPQKPHSATVSKEASIQPASISYDAFGIDVNHFKTQDHLIKKNESLYLMLQHLHLNQRQIYRAIQKAKKVIDIHAFRPKQLYRAYRSKKTKKLQKMVWEPNAVDFVTFSWKDDSLQISRASRAVTKKTTQISGTIHSSLYNAISDRKVRAVLVDKLSDILAWQVNFFNLRKGDSFKVVYDKRYVDGQFLGVGRVRAIKITNMGDTYYAYHYQKGKIDGYYDQKGNSVENALLKIPFKYDQRISSRFNMHRMHPILHRRIPHTGIDYAAPYGTPVLSVGDGTVLEAHYGGAAGNIIKIKHNETYTTAYMHLHKFAKGIHRGAHVKQGEVIGYVGHTGRVTGTHLHYSLYKHNHAVNPLKVKLPSSKSIPDSHMADFHRLRERLNQKLFDRKPQHADSIKVTALP